MGTPFARLAETSRALAATSARGAKVALLAGLLRELPPAEAALAAAWLTGDTACGRPGVGPALLGRLRATAAALEAQLSLEEVDQALRRLAAAEGPGSGRLRERVAGGLFARATAVERELLAGVLAGELRQGALEGVMLAALARATGLPEAEVRRAHMLCGSLAETAHAALAGGIEALRGTSLRVGRPVLPMLAQSADSVVEALAALADPVLEFKLDGARVQLHKDADRVQIFARGGGEVTAAVPELHAFGLALPARRAVLDGEALALRPDGRPWPFQVTLRRFGRASDLPALRAELPLSARWFDCLLLEGQSLLERPGRERLTALEALAPPEARVPRLHTRDPAEGARFLAQALAAGHEGLVAKDLEAPYEAGSRGAAWLKLKKVHTLDLVVLAAEWGSGRRRGWLSNLHLGARGPAGGYVMLGKTFKGLTDELLAWQTTALLEREWAREGHVVHVRPELVVEIAFSDVQRSRHYPGGLALRLARVVRYRPDKRPSEAASLEQVLAIARAEGVLEAPVPC